jgi:hypothetical protein
VILDTNGNIFGGFTPVEWESRPEYPYWKADASLKSFLFTLKNPHNFPGRRFALKAEKKDEAIWCFYDNYNANTDSFTCNFGTRYTNDTGLDGMMFFTGSAEFQVEEIEMIEITS